MDAKTIETAIRDCGLPGRLVGLDGKLILIDVLDETSERLERQSLGVSEFCDLVLDWRARLAARKTSPTAARPEPVPATTAA
ncbi:MAG TPA: hypothetical protein VG245_09420 [Candidatus Dormibacteraeota bacterium]|jgi:hypothetical protein|nr:hypothetical protein [Candidatus Dormibacteraeota bacterium]